MTNLSVKPVASNMTLLETPSILSYSVMQPLSQVLTKALIHLTAPLKSGL